MKNLIVLIFFFGLFHAGNAQGVTAIADTQRIVIGEQFH
jgi:hypothetical protein